MVTFSMVYAVDIGHVCADGVSFSVSMILSFALGVLITLGILWIPEIFSFDK